MTAPACIPIRDTRDGTVYPSIHAAAKATGIDRTTVRRGRRFVRVGAVTVGISPVNKPVVYAGVRYASIGTLARHLRVRAEHVRRAAVRCYRIAGHHVVFDSDAARARLAGVLQARERRPLDLRPDRRIRLWEAVDHRQRA